MQAVVRDRYGSPDVLYLQDLPRPVAGDDEVLLRVIAVGINPADLHLLRADPFFVRFMFGLTKPKNRILGFDLAGVVEAVGKNVTEFHAGDEVYGELSMNSGGGLVEFASVKPSLLVRKPANLTFVEAAAVPMGALTALQALRDAGKLQQGERVLINGASGGVGHFAVQFARAMGAEVTGVCSTRNLEMVSSLGAQHVIDYTREDFTRSGRQYDLIVACNGYHPIRHYQKALTPTGRYVMVGGSNAQMFESMTLGPLLSKKGGQALGSMLANESQKDLEIIRQMIEAGQVSPVVDRTWPLQESVAAFHYLETGHARGKVVIVVQEAG